MFTFITYNTTIMMKIIIPSIIASILIPIIIIEPTITVDTHSVIQTILDDELLTVVNPHTRANDIPSVKLLAEILERMTYNINNISSFENLIQTCTMLV